MSMAALEWAFEVAVEGPAKAVLLVLADHANAEGKCWPGMARMVARSGFQERTVRRALRTLEEAGHIEVGGRPGSTPEYRVLSRPVAWQPVGEQRRLPLVRVPKGGAVREAAPVTAAAPAAKAAPASRSKGAASLAGGAASLAPKPRINQERTKRNRKGEAAPAADAAAPASPRRATRIPDDWQPTEVDAAFARQRGVPLSEVEAFRSYWQGRSGSAATSPNWSARWRTWCMRWVEYRGRDAARARTAGGGRDGALAFLARGGAAADPDDWPGPVIDGVAEA